MHIKSTLYLLIQVHRCAVKLDTTCTFVYTNTKFNGSVVSRILILVSPVVLQ